MTNTAPAKKTPQDVAKHQEVRVRVDVSVTMSAKYSADEIREIIERNARKVFPNNARLFHSVKFAEARHIDKGEKIEWTTINTLTEPGYGQDTN